MRVRDGGVRVRGKGWRGEGERWNLTFEVSNS